MAPTGAVVGRCSNDMRPSILRCLAFKRRPEGPVPELQPGRGPDGLYPGQLKPEEVIMAVTTKSTLTSNKNRKE